MDVALLESESEEVVEEEELSSPEVASLLTTGSSSDISKTILKIATEKRK